MGRLKRTPGPRAALIGAVLMWLGVVIVVGASASPRQDNPVASSKATAPAVQGTSPKPANQSSANSGEYVGEEKCLECHEDQEEVSRHAARARKEPAHARCEEHLRNVPRSG